MKNWKKCNLDYLASDIEIDVYKSWRIRIKTSNSAVAEVSVVSVSNDACYFYEVQEIDTGFADLAKRFIDNLENPKPENLELKFAVEKFIYAKHELDRISNQKIDLIQKFSEVESRLINAVKGCPNSLVYPLESGAYAVFYFNWEDGNIVCDIVEGIEK